MKLGRVQMKLLRCWVSGVRRKRHAQSAVQLSTNSKHPPAELVLAIHQAASHFSGQLYQSGQPQIVEYHQQQQQQHNSAQLQIVESQQQYSGQLQIVEATPRAGQVQIVEQVEQVQAFHTVRLLRDSILNPEDEEDFSTGLRPTSLLDYTLDIDFTAAKVVDAVLEKCKLFQCLSVLYKEGCHQLLSALEDLHDLLLLIQGSACLDTFKEFLEEILLYSTKAYAFIEKVCLKAMSNSLHSLHAHNHRSHKTHEKFIDFSWKFHTQTVMLGEQYEKTLKDIVLYGSAREERLSYGVVTYLVPIHNLAERLYKKKRAVLHLTEVNGESGYTVELSYPRTWRTDDVGLTSRVESNDRGYRQILQSARVKIEKGGWGWEAAQDTVLITYDDLLVANVASTTGSLLRFNKESAKEKRVSRTQTYRTSVQVVGSSRIDLDLQHLFIKGTKDKDHVYLKCSAASEGEEVLALYRYHRHHFHKAEGLLHFVGRGNQPGLRHVLVSIFSSLGFTSAV